MTREEKEVKNLFDDPKWARKAWRSVGTAILNNPAVAPIEDTNSDGDLTKGAQIEKYAYAQLARDLKEVTKENRAPTELEMILMCQIVKARTDTSAAIFVRDTLGAKPVDESKVETTTNQFESLSDEELQLLADFRAKKTTVVEEASESDEVR